MHEYICMCFCNGKEVKVATCCQHATQRFKLSPARSPTLSVCLPTNEAKWNATLQQQKQGMCAFCRQHNIHCSPVSLLLFYQLSTSAWGPLAAGCINNFIYFVVLQLSFPFAFNRNTIFTCFTALIYTLSIRNRYKLWVSVFMPLSKCHNVVEVTVCQPPSTLHNVARHSTAREIVNFACSRPLMQTAGSV